MQNEDNTTLLREEAFIRVYEQSFERIFRYCVHMTGNEEEGFDLAQEVFVRAAGQANFLDEGFKIQAWLFCVARNLCLSFFRELKKKLGLARSMGRELAHGTEIRKSDEQYMVINHLINELPQKFSSIIYLRYFEDLSYDEIAQVEQVPVNTVRTRLLRAKARLREVIEDEEDL